MSDVKCYAVAVGNMPSPLASRKVKKSAKAALKYIQGQDGFLGFHPMPPNGTLCIFDTENNAKIARNMMDLMGIQTGYNITEVFVDERYIRKGDGE